MPFGMSSSGAITKDSLTYGQGKAGLGPLQCEIRPAQQHTLEDTLEDVKTALHIWTHPFCSKHSTSKIPGALKSGVLTFRCSRCQQSHDSH